MSDRGEGEAHNVPPVHAEASTLRALIVLPFVTKTDACAVVASGMSEELGSILGRTGEVAVISHASAEALAAVGGAPEALAARAGVDYAVAGRLRSANGRIRVSAELVEANTGRSLWSGRFDAAAGDTFEVEDALAEALVGTLLPRLRWEEIARARARPTESLAARDLLLCAYPHLWTHREDDNALALDLLARALALDPGYGRAAALAAWGHAQRVVYLWGNGRDDREAGLRFAATAAASGRDDPTALAALAAARTLLEGAFDGAAALAERALSLDPTHAWAWSRLGYARLYAGAPEEAIRAFERSIALSPLDPMTFNNLMGIANAHFDADRPAEAVAFAERALAENPAMTWGYRELAVYRAAAGEHAAARAAIDRFLESRPGITVADVEARLAPLAPWFGSRYRALLRGVWPSVAAPPPAAEAPQEATLVREGALWLVRFAGVSAHLPDLKGLHNVARLIAAPGTEVHCLDLAERVVADDAGAPLLDGRARAALKARLGSLREDFAEAERMNDIGRAERAQEEIEALVGALTGAFGLGGRARRLGDSAERARTAVAWRIRHVLRRLETAHPPLHRHLARSLRTGTFCVYDPERPVAWRLDQFTDRHQSGR